MVVLTWTPTPARTKKSKVREAEIVLTHRGGAEPNFGGLLGGSGTQPYAPTVIDYLSFAKPNTNSIDINGTRNDT